VLQAISASANHTCAIDLSDAAHCWGWNGSGQLGTGLSIVTSSVPAPVAGGYRFRIVSAGERNSCGITLADQTLCWGTNEWGQLANGGAGFFRNVPEPVASTNTFSAIAVGYGHVCAMTSTGSTDCWGLQMYGALGNGREPLVQTTPMPVLNWQ
jgi:alpha-tubulin suppressor-like RCC1 family protein